jgi:hypothetical protein
VIPRAAHCSTQPRHVPEALDHATRRENCELDATLSSATRDRCQHTEASCIDIIHARQIQRHIGCGGVLQMRYPQTFVRTMTKNQPAACA